MITYLFPIPSASLHNSATTSQQAPLLLSVHYSTGKQFTNIITLLKCSGSVCLFAKTCEAQRLPLSSSQPGHSICFRYHMW